MGVLHVLMDEKLAFRGYSTQGVPLAQVSI
jgi:hypothetical protein